MRIEDEIQQTKFANEYIKADVNIIFTANWLTSRLGAILKPHDVSIQQFNILRILKGQYPNPAPLNLVTKRMLDKMSNTSRLVDKLFKKGLVVRKICENNRRQVDILITDKGLETCEMLTEVLNKARNEEKWLSKSEAGQLSDLLDKFRGED